MRPLFSVGEEAILQSVCYPEFNGKCVVLDIKGPGRHNILTADGSKTIEAFLYRTTIKRPGDDCWSEVALKKKHEPGESFKSIMSSLKVKEKV